MKKIIGLSFLLIMATQAHAADARDAASAVKKYSEAIACQLEFAGHQQKNQYKAVNVNPGDPRQGGLNALFVVYWEGDVGCAGGSGTILPHFTIVEHSGFVSATPVVKTDYKFPELDLVRMTKMSGRNGKLWIQGLTYGPNDPLYSPTKKVSYSLRFIKDEFVRQ
jgi:hypothetical protein